MRAGRLWAAAGLCLLLSALAFWENPLLDFRVRHPEFLGRLLFLYGYPWLAGALLLAFRGRLFILASGWGAALALAGLPWLLVWSFIWSRIVAPGGASLGWQGLFFAQCLGLGLALAGLLSGWVTRQGAWFPRVLGWILFFASVMNLTLQPGLWALAFSALGGALAALATLKRLGWETADGL
ncbi:MAG TPA: hypothetical protein VMU88_00990 [bacterium]|nr:hypothetical protein [bacterium]